MRGMKFRPRFSLRMVFVLIALISLPMGWVAYQLNWIRQRHEFLSKQVHRVQTGIKIKMPPPPWSLRLFGEQSGGDMDTFWYISPSQLENGRRLFPELSVNKFLVIREKQSDDDD